MPEDVRPRPFRSAGRWLATQRRKHGLTQEALAALIERDQTMVSRYELGTAQASDEVAAAIARVFNLSERGVREALGLYVPSAKEAAADPAVLRLPVGVELTDKQRKAIDALLEAFLDDIERAST